MSASSSREAHGNATLDDERDERALSFRMGRMACALCVFSALLGSTAPSPLYAIYVDRWSIDHGTVSAIFSVYAAGTLLTLLLLGRFGSRIADRRRIILPALFLVAAGALLFGTADGVASLFAGRFLAGVGTGAITGTATAALYELERPAKRSRAATLATLAFTGGAAFGPVLSSAAIAADAAPTLLPLLTIAALAIVSALALCLARWPRSRPAGDLPFDPEPVAPHDEPAGRIASPRMDFALASVTVAVAWVVGSMLMAIGPSLATNLFALSSSALAGLFPAAFQVFAGAGQFLFGRMRPAKAIAAGLVGIALTQALLALGAQSGALWMLVALTPFCGLAYGAAFVGAASLATASAPAARRTEIVSRFYMVGYLANALPVLALGFLIDTVGFASSFLISSALIVCAAGGGVALALFAARRGSEAAKPG